MAKKSNEGAFISWWGEDKKTGLAKAMELREGDLKKPFYVDKEIKLYFKGRLAESKQGGLLFNVRQNSPAYNYAQKTRATVAEFSEAVAKSADRFVINAFPQSEIWKDRGAVHEQGHPADEGGYFCINYIGMLSAKALKPIPGASSFFVNCGKPSTGELWTHCKVYALDDDGKIVDERIVGYIRASDCRRVVDNSGQFVEAAQRSF